jgi:23S rRNA pseudouridine2605 synthase
MIRKNNTGKSPARKQNSGSSRVSGYKKATPAKKYRSEAPSKKAGSFAGKRNEDDAAPRRKSTSSYSKTKSESRTTRSSKVGDKKPYGTSSSFSDRKKLKSLAEGRQEPENKKADKKSERAPRTNTTKQFESPKGKGRFTKKNELKGFKPKISAKDEVDYRFKKPGSKGKQLILEEQEDLGKKKLKGNTKEWVTEKALKQGEEIRINRYISNAGVCSRREADELIAAGLVTVNGQVVTELGLKVKAGDIVKFNGEKLNVEAKVYIILNKPKDAITTSDDPEGRNTVMDLFEGKMRERIYPVGRLDRNTTGVLLLTNDGEMSQRLMHPKYEVKKVYKATLNKIIKPTDLWTLANGVELEDGFIKPDALGQPDPKDKSVVGVEIHSGKNRIIHRIFEHLGYTVDKLDRVLYAGLEKGKLKRGEWRELTEKELKQLKRMVHLK